jgi:hypothetical protein
MNRIYWSNVAAIGAAFFLPSRTCQHCASITENDPRKESLYYLI